MIISFIQSAFIPTGTCIVVEWSFVQIVVFGFCLWTFAVFHHYDLAKMII